LKSPKSKLDELISTLTSFGLGSEYGCHYHSTTLDGSSAMVYYCMEIEEIINALEHLK